MQAFDPRKLGNAVYQYRHRKRLSQDDLASMVGLSPNTIFKYENGLQSPGADKVWLLSQALDCTPNDLLGWPAKAGK